MYLHLAPPARGGTPFLLLLPFLLLPGAAVVGLRIPDILNNKNKARQDQVAAERRLSNLCGTPEPGFLHAWFQENKHVDRKLVNKVDSYLPTYERYLTKFRGKKVNILELGVQSGGSQEMWLDFFGPEARVYGVDVEEAVKGFNSPRVQNFIGDIGDPEFLESVCTQGPPGGFDFILDDASHVNWHQRQAFEILFSSCLNPEGGVYMVEDLMAPILPHVGFVEFAKGKVDEFESYLSCEDGSSSRLVRSKGKCENGEMPFVPTTEFTRTAHALHFHDGIVVVEKVPRREVGKAIFAGNQRVEKRTVHFVGLSEEEAKEKRNAMMIRRRKAKVGTGMSDGLITAAAPSA